MSGRDFAIITYNLQKQMEFELRDFYRDPIDRNFQPKLEAFLRKWEENFAPFVLLKFTYRIDGNHLDILASIPDYAPGFTRFIIDFRWRRI